MALTATQLTEIRALRILGWRLTEAVNHARLSEKVREAEETGLINFNWVYDDDYDPMGMTDDAEFAEIERRNLASGKWEAMGCVARAPVAACCRTCQRGAEPGESSLWGIVVESADTIVNRHGTDITYIRDPYRRDVEINQALELGVISMPS